MFASTLLSGAAVSSAEEHLDKLHHGRPGTIGCLHYLTGVAYTRSTGVHHLENHQTQETASKVSASGKREWFKSHQLD